MKELIYSQHLLPAVEQQPGRVCFVDGARRRTLGEHFERSCRLADSLRRGLGLAREDRFAVLALNSLEFAELYHAAYLGAAVINPLNLRLAPAELAYILADSATRVAFVDRHFAPLVARIRAETRIEKVVLVGGGDVPHDLAYEDLVGAGDPRLPDEPEETDPVVLMYTGGTTGLPKGVLLEQRAQMLNLLHVMAVVKLRNDDVFLLQTPMFHAASMPAVLTAPVRGSLSTFLPMFDPAASIAAIERERVTTTTMVPTMIGMVLASPEYRRERLASLRYLSYGASPMPQALLERLQSELPDVELFQGYGMTEASTLLTALLPEDHKRGGKYLRSAGKALPGVRLQIQDAEGRPLPAGQTGEVCARAGNMLREYWNKPEATAEALRDGWYHSGDAGFLDEEGYLFLVDRVKDMIVTGGENVYSVEVEQAIASHPAVAQVAVIGIPDEVWGEAVHAVVVPRPGAACGAEEIIEHARERIANYKVPKSVDVRAEPLPLSGALKVLKRELRAPFWKGRERGVN